MTIDWKQTEKQTIAWNYLNDDITEELLFGGGAGGGKSLLGCANEIISAMKYPGTRGGIGRKELKSLKSTTLKTFFEVCKRWGIKKDVHFKYNDQKSEIYWANGSETILVDLAFQPSDPEFEFLGSFEFTRFFADECSQIKFKAWETLGTRLRYKLENFCGHCASTIDKEKQFIRQDIEIDKNSGVVINHNVYKCKCGKETRGLIPKLFGSCNPSVEWTKQEFYTPDKKGILPDHKKFVQALAKDNPFLPASYIIKLNNIKTKATRERLLNGNWDYDDDKSALFSYDTIMDCVGREISLFKPYLDRIADLKKKLDELPINEVVERQKLKISLEAEEKRFESVKNVNKFIVGDVARKGRDGMPLSYWEGLELKEIVEIPQHIQQNTVLSSKYILDYATKKGVRKSHILLDEGGVGGGVVDQVGCKGFIDSSSAIQPKEAKYDETKRVSYGNLRSQCAIELALYMEEGKIGFDKKIFDDKPELLELLIQEFQQIKQRDIDKDTTKIYITKKEDIIANIKRSPDLFDMIKMRMWFELNHSFGGLLIA